MEKGLDDSPMARGRNWESVEATSGERQERGECLGNAFIGSGEEGTGRVFRRPFHRLERERNGKSV